MNKLDTVSIALLILLVMGIYIAYIGKSKLPSISSSITDRVKNLLDKRLEQSIKLDSYELSRYYNQIQKYNYIRIGVIAILTIIVVVKVLFGQGGWRTIVVGLFTIIILSVITFPVKKIGRYNTPFDIFLKRIITSQEKKLDREIYASSMVLKNLAIINREKSLSTDYILQQIFEQSNNMKTYYAQMISLYREGKSKAAFQSLTKAVNTKTCKNFALILSKLDTVGPENLIDQISVFQTIIVEEKFTSQVKSIDRRSLILTVVSTASVFLLLLDFMIVVVFMDTLSMLENFF